MNRKPKMQRYPLKAFQKQFPDDASCLEWLKNRLYPEGILCKNCERDHKALSHCQSPILLLRALRKSCASDRWHDLP